MATLEILEQKVAALEQELAQLKVGLSGDAPAQQPREPSRGARLIREAAESHNDVAAGWQKLLENLGIQGQPIGAKKQREVLLANGINPDDNEFSRDIIAMREE